MILLAGSTDGRHCREWERKDVGVLGLVAIGDHQCVVVAICPVVTLPGLV